MSKDNVSIGSNVLMESVEPLQDFALQFRDGRLVLKNAKGDTVLRMDTSPIQSITLRDGWLFVAGHPPFFEAPK